MRWIGPAGDSHIVHQKDPLKGTQIAPFADDEDRSDHAAVPRRRDEWGIVPGERDASPQGDSDRYGADRSTSSSRYHGDGRSTATLGAARTALAAATAINLRTCGPGNKQAAALPR